MPIKLNSDPKQGDVRVVVNHISDDVAALRGDLNAVAVATEIAERHHSH